MVRFSWQVLAIPLSDVAFTILWVYCAYGITKNKEILPEPIRIQMFFDRLSFRGPFGTNRHRAEVRSLCLVVALPAIRG